MIKIRLLPSLVLLAVFLAACAPATSPVAPAQLGTVEPTATFPPPVPTLDTSVQTTAGPTESMEPTPVAIATSRGPNLEATDPSTVNLAAGQLQLVEFFRFT